MFVITTLRTGDVVLVQYMKTPVTRRETVVSFPRSLDIVPRRATSRSIRANGGGVGRIRIIVTGRRGSPDRLGDPPV
jgi:hypothetical protein